MLRNITWLAAASAAVKPAWFLFITAACMRLLGAEGYGILSTALALAMLVMATTDLGMTSYSVREVARDPSAATRFLSNFLAVRVVASMVAFAVTLGIAASLGYDPVAIAAVACAGVYVAALGLLAYCRAFFEAFEDLRMDALSIAAEKVLVIAFGLALLLLTRSASWTLAGMAVGMSLALWLALRWVSRRFAPIVLATVSKEFVFKHLRLSLPFGVAGVLAIVYYRTDLVMIEAFRGATEAGQYAVAFRILEALNLLPFIVVQAAMYPRFSALHHQRAHQAFADLLRRGALLLLIPSVIVALLLTLWSEVVIHVLDPNPVYEPAGAVLQVLCWTFPLTCLNVLLYVALFAIDEQVYRVKALGLAVVLNIGLNVVLIPRYGIMGAAVATVASEVFVVAAYAWRYRFRNAAFVRRSAPVNEAADA